MIRTFFFLYGTFAVDVSLFLGERLTVDTDTLQEGGGLALRGVLAALSCFLVIPTVVHTSCFG